MPRDMRVVPYDGQWPTQFEAVKAALAAIFGDLAVDIQHVGSTSIVGMWAKPILNIIVLVTDIAAVDGLTDRMEMAGYLPRGERGMAGRRYFVKLAGDGVNHTQHIHCYEKENPMVFDMLLFRGYVRMDRESFERYKAVKIEASQKFRHPPAEYTEYKTGTVRDILAKARQHRE